MGWKDLFGSSLSTVRQKAYVEALRLDTLFTPLVIVQGRAHCVGTDQEAMLSAITSAPRFIASTFQATFQKPSPDSLLLTLSRALSNKFDEQGTNVMVALLLERIGHNRLHEWGEQGSSSRQRLGG